MIDPTQIVQAMRIWALPILFAITLHEAAHGWVASKLGDKTALMLGRVTLNPMKHIDLFGTILLHILLLSLGGFVFGWAKPVPVNERNLHHPKRDIAIVALAGPIANLLMCLFWAAACKLALILLHQEGSQHWAGLLYMGRAGMMINAVLAVLNLLPLPPLDGGRVLTSLLPQPASSMIERLEPYGFWILLAMLALGVLHTLILPPTAFVVTTVAHWFQLR